MSSSPKYPLEQVLSVKKDRVEKAEKVVTQKKAALQVEQDKFTKIKKERDAVLLHHNEKLAQLRQVLDEGTTSDEVLQMKIYLKVVKEKLAKEEIKVKEQEKNVRIAEKNLEDARLDLKRKRVEEEKIETHKVQWSKKETTAIADKEAKDQDEIGQILYESKRRKDKK